MCNYQGYEFGASYPDSVCMDGQLWDADNCDGESGIIEPIEYIPCPMCYPWDYIVFMTTRHDDFSILCLESWHSFYCALRLWIDIKKNRLFGIEPWN